MNKLLVVFLALSIHLSSFACSEDGKGGFLPENDLFIGENDKNAGGITQEQFNAEIDKYETIYAPIIQSMGGRLKVNRKWSDGTVNASAMRSGRTYNVNMFGGLARHPAITPDGFALVICHEIGHHIGGAPKVTRMLNTWASNEGQSDYFATLKCLRKAFINEDNAAMIANMNVPPFVTQKCSEVYTNEIDRNICIRGSMAGASVANLFASLRSQPEGKFDTPDSNVVGRTNDSHPAHQCRLDTYFQGALCDQPFTEDVEQNSEVTGTCHATRGHSIGLRPLCWFAPKVN